MHWITGSFRFWGMQFFEQVSYHDRGCDGDQIGGRRRQGLGREEPRCVEEPWIVLVVKIARGR